MPQFINFYENVSEAKIRLEGTLVMYDGMPYYVYHVADHEDGKIRAYLDDFRGGSMIWSRVQGFPRAGDYSPSSYPAVINEWYQNNKGKGLLRKEIGSPMFNKFRPFPLGNVNIGGSVIYTERTPTRNTNQGLRERSVFALNVLPVPNPTTGQGKRAKNYSFNNETSIQVFGPEFYTMLLGEYPTAQEILDAFKDPSVINTGAAFHREFSLFRGPLDMIILCYRDEGIGILPDGDLSSVVVGSRYSFLKESIQDLNCFQSVQTK